MIELSISRQRLSLCMVVIGALTAQFFFLRVTPLSFGIGCTCAMLFLVAYSRFANKWKMPLVLAFAYHATGIAYSLAIGLLVLLTFPPPARPTPPILPSTPLISIIGFFMGGDLNSIVTEFVRAIVIIFSYALSIIMLGVTASLISCLFLRRHPFARWILIGNVPWLLLTTWLVFAMLYESMS